MNTVIVYSSAHHGNTEKVLRAMVESTEVELFRVVDVDKIDFSKYDTIGFASGIYYGQMSASIQNLFSRDDLDGKNIFIIYTCGFRYRDYSKSAQTILKKKACRIVGVFYCRGWDTYGPFRYIGGVARNHPNEKDLRSVRNFIKKILHRENSSV